MVYLVLSEGSITYGYIWYVGTGVTLAAPLGEVDQIRFSSPPTMTRSPGKPENVASGTEVTEIFRLMGVVLPIPERLRPLLSTDSVSIVTACSPEAGWAVPLQEHTR
jgi:hypothetical protein